MATIPAADPKTTPRTGALDENLAWLLAQASHVLATELTAAFESLGVPPRGHCVLSVASGGQFTQKELADEIGLDKTTMVVTLDELEHQGLAKRVPSPADRRARIIEVTPAGRRLVARGEEVASSLQSDVLASLPAREREAFMSALHRLVWDRLGTPAACSRAPRRRR